MNPDEIKQNVLKLQNSGASPADIENYVKSAVSAPPVSPPNPDILPGVSSVLDTIFGGGKVGEAIGAGVAKTGLTGLSPEERKNVSFPSAGSVAGDIGGIALELGTLGGVGTGGKLASQVVKNAALGGGFGLTSSLKADQGLKETAKNVETGVLLGGAFPIVSAGLSKIAQKINLPTRILQTVGFDEKGASNVLASNKFGTAGKMIEGSKTAQAGLENNLQTLLNSAPLDTTKIKTANVLEDISQHFNARGAAESPETILGTLFKSVRNSRGLLGKEELTLAETNQLRRNIDSILNDRDFQKKLRDIPQTKRILLQASQIFGNTVKDTSEAVLSSAGVDNPDIVRKIFDEYRREINFTKVLEKAGQPSKVLTARDILRTVLGPTSSGTIGALEGYREGGISGAVKGGLTGLAVGAALKPAGRINIAQGLSRAAGVIPTTAIKTGVLKAATNQ